MFEQETFKLRELSLSSKSTQYMSKIGVTISGILMAGFTKNWTRKRSFLYYSVPQSFVPTSGSRANIFLRILTMASCLSAPSPSPHQLLSCDQWEKR